MRHLQKVSNVSKIWRNLIKYSLINYLKERQLGGGEN